MSDEPFYSPNLRPRLPAREPKPREPLWRVELPTHTWTCELIDQGEWGIEAHILRNGELVYGQRFETRELATAWAEDERMHLP
jgi:hypothetical protein